MNIDNARTLKAHFEQFNGFNGRVRNVRLVKLTFHVGVTKTAEYYGVEYDSVHHYEPQERHVTEGGKKAGDEYTERRYELIGVQHRIMAAQKKIMAGVGEYCSKYVWRFDGDDGDWYVGGQFPGPKNDYHPFDKQFGLSRWPHENPWHGRIDQHDDVKRERRKVAVEYLD